MNGEDSCTPQIFVSVATLVLVLVTTAPVIRIGSYVDVAGAPGGGVSADAVFKHEGAAIDRAWTRQFGSSAADTANGVAVDASGVYVVGFTAGALPGQPSAGAADAFVRKYDLDGNEVWTRQFGSSQRDEAQGVAVDASGVYVAGFTTGALPGQTSAGEFDAFLRKYDLEGNEVWTRQFGTWRPDAVADVAFGASAIYVFGPTLGNFTGETIDGYEDVFVRKYDPDGNEVWTRQFESSGYDEGWGVAVDASGVYVAGSAGGTLPGQTSAGSADVFVRKYDPDGNEVWTRQFGSSAADSAYAVAADASGGYLAGFTSGAFPGQTNAGSGDAFIRRYDRDGEETWTRQFGSSGVDAAEGVAVNGSGAYVTGHAGDALPGQASAGSADVFVRKYDPDGNEVWTRQFGTSGADEGWGVAVDASGVYLAGRTDGAFPDQTNAGFTDAFVAKVTEGAEGPPNGLPTLGGIEPLPAVVILGQEVRLSASCTDPDGDILTYMWDFGDGSIARGTTPPGGGTINATHAYMAVGTYTVTLTVNDGKGGDVAASASVVVTASYTGLVEILWIRQFGTSSGAVAVAADPSGVYVAGGTGGALPGQTNAGLEDAYLRKYDASGTELWTRQFGTSSGDGAAAVAADPSGVYVAGSTGGAFPGQTHAGGESDAFFRKYDASGTELWTRQFGTSSYDTAVAVAADPSGVYVAGSTVGALPGQTSAGSSDAYLRKYDASGTELWTRQFGTGSDDHAYAVAADPSGVYVAGHTWGALPGQTYAGYADAYLRKYDASGTELWTRQFGTSSYDTAYAVTADPSGVYVSGSTDGTFPGQTGNSDAYLRKYDASGTELWTRQFGTSSVDEAHAVAADPSGVYVAGYTWGTFPGQTSAGDYDADAYLRKYDASGTELWTRQFGTGSYDTAYAVAADPSGVYVAGVIGTYEGDYSDAFLAKFSEEAPNGVPTVGGIEPLPAVAVPGQEVRLNASCTDFDGDILTYTWDFGDGSIATGTTSPGGGTITATHAYTAAGTYPVELTVDDGNGGVTTQSANVRVVAPLSLDASAQPIAGSIPLTVSFGGNPSGGLPPYSFGWDFGDGGASTSQNPTHTYEAAGTYDATLTVTDAQGRTATRTIQIVASGPSGSTPPTVIDVPPWTLYALAAAVAIGVGTVVVRRWRKRVRTPPSPPGSS